MMVLITLTQAELVSADWVDPLLKGLVAAGLRLDFSWRDFQRSTVYMVYVDA